MKNFWLRRKSCTNLIGRRVLIINYIEIFAIGLSGVIKSVKYIEKAINQHYKDNSFVFLVEIDDPQKHGIVGRSTFEVYGLELMMLD